MQSAWLDLLSQADYTQARFEPWCWEETAMGRLATSLLVALIVTFVGPVGRSVAQPSAHIKDGYYKGSREACGRLAVQSLGVTEKFPFAEITADGNVRGWSDRSEALVLFLPTAEPDRIQIVALTTSNGLEEAARLGVAIVTNVASGVDDPKLPTRIAPKDGKLPARPTTLTWKSKSHAVTPVLSHFSAAAAIAMEKKGLSAKPQPSVPLAFGSTKEKLLIAFLGTGEKSHTCGLYVVTVTFGEDVAEKLTTDVLDQINNILFD